MTRGRSGIDTPIVLLRCSPHPILHATTLALALMATASAQEDFVIRPVETVLDQYSAQLPAESPPDEPFTLYHIVVRDEHSSLAIRLRGEDGDADLLLAAGEPIDEPGEAVLASAGPGSREAIRLGRNTLPALATGDYFLYVLRSAPGEEPLDLSVRLNLPADEGLEEVPELPQGVRLPTAEEQSSSQAEAVIEDNCQVRLAMPAGSPAGVREFDLVVPEGTLGLDIYLRGNQSDIDLQLLGPVIEGAEARLEFSSTNPLSTEEISVRSRRGSPLPAGTWNLMLLRRDQHPAEPLMLRVDMLDDLTAGARNVLEARGPATETLRPPVRERDRSRPAN